MNLKDTGGKPPKELHGADCQDAFRSGGEKFNVWMILNELPLKKVLGVI